jgi:hypothetical protein
LIWDWYMMFWYWFDVPDPCKRWRFFYEKSLLSGPFVYFWHIEKIARTVSWDFTIFF